MPGPNGPNINNVNKLGVALRDLTQFYLAGISESTQFKVPVWGVGSLLGSTMSSSAVQSILDIKGTVEYATKSLSQDTLRNLIAILLDTTEGAYFTKDILTNTFLFSKFQELSANIGDMNTGKFVKIVYEPETCSAPEAENSGFYVTEATPPLKPVSGNEADAEKASISLIIKSSLDNENTSAGKYKDNWVNLDPKNPDRYKSPTLSAFIFPSHLLSPSVRNTDVISLFCNAIPGIEMSRCVPYINVKFVSAVPPVLGERTKQLSILRFLGMVSDDKTSREGIGMSSALPSGLGASLNLDTALALEGVPSWGDIISLSSAGMELFTSPQTMVNMDVNDGSVGRNAALDLLQPLMTLESLKVDIQGLGQDILANKVGMLSFVLHDRSRMSDIAPLISADIFAGTYLLVDYGWSHPDSDNPYGALLNAMRSQSAFNIQATNFTMGQDGQARFNMKLASRGEDETNIIPIACGALMPVGPMRSIVERYLSKMLDEGVKATGQEGSKEIREKINITMGATTSGGSVIPRKLFLDFQKLLFPGHFSDPQHEPAQPGIKDLSDIIDELIGKADNPEDKGADELQQKSLVSEVMCKLRATLETPDPFYPTHIPPSVKQDLAAKGAIKQPISLGKILTVFIGGSLAGSGRFDEVQMLFYRFNHQAGAAREYESIANFILDSDVLRSELVSYISAFPSCSVRGFLNMINDKFVSNVVSPNYGLTTEKGAQRKAGEAKSDQPILKEVATVVTDKLAEIYADGGGTPEFQVPQLRMTFECLPAFEANDDPLAPTFSLNADKNILRVHIYDKKSNPHTDEMFLLQCMNDSEVAVKLAAGGSGTTSAEAGGKTDSNASSGIAETAENPLKYVARIDDSSSSRFAVYTSLVGPDLIKKIIKTTTPSITFGLSTSAITSVSISSNTGGSVGNVLLLEAIADNDMEGRRTRRPTQRAAELEDVMVIPANITMSLLGCPLFEYGQTFFVDMLTGTTVDNMYGVVGLSHTISSGQFETNLTLGFQGSGTVRNFRSILEGAQAKINDEAKKEGG